MECLVNLYNFYCSNRELNRLAPALSTEYEQIDKEVMVVGGTITLELITRKICRSEETKKNR
jgi:hypothetical protein